MKTTVTRLLAAHAAAQATLAIASLYALLPLSIANPSFLYALLLYPLFMLFASLPASLAADAEQACATIDRSLLSGLSDAPDHASCADACACIGQHAALLTRRYPNGTIATIEQTNDCAFSSIAAWVMIIGICNFTLSVARLAVAAAAIKFARRPRLAGLRALTTAIHSFVGISLLPMIVYTYFAADVLRLFYAASAEAQLASGASSVSCPASIESQRVGVLFAMWGCWAAGLLLHLHFGRVVYLVKQDVKRKKAEVRRVALEATGTEPAVRADEELEEGRESIATCRAEDECTASDVAALPTAAAVARNRPQPPPQPPSRIAKQLDALTSMAADVGRLASAPRYRTDGLLLSLSTKALDVGRATNRCAGTARFFPDELHYYFDHPRHRRVQMVMRYVDMIEPIICAAASFEFRLDTMLEYFPEYDRDEPAHRLRLCFRARADAAFFSERAFPIIRAHAKSQSAPRRPEAT